MVIYRVPKKLSIAFPSSYCPACKKPIKWHDNMPVLSFLALGGKCRQCGHKIPFKYPLVEFLTGLLFFLIFLHFGLEKIYFFYIIMVGYLIALSVIDIEKRIVPDVIIVFLFVTGALFGVFELNKNVTIFDGIIGAASAGFVIYVLNYFSNGKIGEGDVKLFMALGMCLGPVEALKVILYSFIIGGIISGLLLLTGRYSRKDALAFVPFIAAAFIVRVFLQ